MAGQPQPTYTYKQPDVSKITNKIREWAWERDLNNKDKQFLKMIEELGELSEAIIKGDKEEMLQEFGDVYITLTITAKLNGINIEDAINKAYKKISKREGQTINGTFVKSEDLPNSVAPYTMQEKRHARTLGWNLDNWEDYKKYFNLKG